MSNHLDHHAPPPREITHGIVWLVGLMILCAMLVGCFYYWFGVGEITGRNMGPMPKQLSSEPEPDHAALIADRSPAVLTHGETVYLARCASCHGSDGGGNPSDARIRKFTKEAFKAPHGGGPYGFYMTLTDGWANMQSVRASISVTDRYAVTHYVREKIVKPNNSANYAESDPAAVTAKIPKKGSGAGGEIEIDPRSVTAPKGTAALMADSANTATARVAVLEAWIRSAALAPADQSALLTILNTRAGTVDALHQAIAAAHSAAAHSAAAHSAAAHSAAAKAALAAVFPLRAGDELDDVIKALSAAPGVDL